ncbi:MAG: DEAD/DEAH box helicase [bacterium]|nr:DEAD/DEAH box helicase [bacterium]
MNKPKKTKKIPYHRKPENLSIEEWQIGLRKQFAPDQDFDITNTGTHPVFSDFSVYNSETGSTYKVAIRSQDSGNNFCSCPDFTINTLGTCKHIEYVLFRLRSMPKTAQFFNEPVSLPYTSISIHYGTERKIYLRIGSEKSNRVKKLAQKYFDESHYLLPDALFSLDTFIKSISGIDPGFRIYPDAVEYIYNLREAELRKERVNSLFYKGIETPVFNNLIKTDLYPYQRAGVIFGALSGRFLLADEMGLGKTIEALALSELLLREFDCKNILIICPTSLKYQWLSEISKFTNREALVVEGNSVRRKERYESDAAFKIISYGIVGNDLDALNSCDFDLVILDEAQRIKNWKTKTAQSVKKIASQYAIVLTGTPLENRIEELHSIIEFVDRYKLGALFRFLYNHQLYDDSGKVIGYQGLHDINKSLKDILLRRTKNEIKDQLPDRLDKTYFLEMTPEQWDMHDNFYTTVSRLVHLWRRQGFLSREDRERLLISLNCMRMSCDSTYILDQEARHDVKIKELMNILEEIFENNDEKVVIFSQWERMTSLVSQELQKIGVQFEYLHGKIPAKKRNQLISDFHNNPNSRVFLSTDAGGVGLNLQCANVIINIDLPWNPAVLEQRIARIYRLGQKKTVRVINLVSRGTIEHRILYLLEFKKSIFKGVLEEGEDTVLMSDTNIKGFMESVEALTEVTSKDIYVTPYAESPDEENRDYETREFVKPALRKNKALSRNNDRKDGAGSFLNMIRKSVFSAARAFKQLWR